MPNLSEQEACQIRCSPFLVELAKQTRNLKQVLPQLALVKEGSRHPRRKTGRPSHPLPSRLARREQWEPKRGTTRGKEREQPLLEHDPHASSP